MSPSHSIKEARHDIEAASPALPCELGIRVQPGVGAPPESALFAVVDGFRSQTMTLMKAAVRFPVAAGRVWRTSAFHFDKHESASASNDQVDLDAICANVARNDAIPSRFEE